MIGSTILVIAADLATRRFIGLKLKEAGAKVLLAPTAKEGLILAWRDRPDGILIDPDLPDLDGLELVRKLRHDRRTAHTPIIALSGNSQPDAILSGLEAGFDEYLIKSPAAVEQLLQAFRRRLHAVPGGTPAPQETGGAGGRLLLFASPKGGVGTSSLCVNTAAMIAEDHPDWQLAVVDLVLPIGSLAAITGVEAMEINLVQLCALPPDRLTTAYLREHLPIPEEWGFRLVPGAPDPESAANLAVDRLPALFTTLQMAFDMVVVDIGRMISPRITTPLFHAANLIVLVLNSDPTTVGIAHIFLEYLSNQGITQERIFPLVNRSVGVQGLSRRELEQELGLKLPATIPYMQENFSLANTLHQPIGYKFPHYTATVALREASKGILHRIQQQQAVA